MTLAGIMGFIYVIAKQPLLMINIYLTAGRIFHSKRSQTETNLKDIFGFEDYLTFGIM